jgi:thiol:disulfide interchange protein
MISKNSLLRNFLCAVCILTLTGSIKAQTENQPALTNITDVTTSTKLVEYEQESSSAHIEPARMDDKIGIAVIFEGTDDLHYYASSETAPAPGLELKVELKSDYFIFGNAVFPKWELFTDALGKKIEVYVGDFIVFVPITFVSIPSDDNEMAQSNIKVKISGIACTSMLCLPPFEHAINSTVDWTLRDSWNQISFATLDDTDDLEDTDETDETVETDETTKTIQGPDYSIGVALGLAFLAGLILNIMPCVWPVLPLIVMRIVKQAEQSKGKATAMGLTFCLGILLFFACLATASIILQSFYDTSLGWGDHLRNPIIAMALAILMILMALFMFGLFTITVPSSIAGKSGTGQGYIGSIGMGFLAAILSTPCSFGILTVAFVWAQAQPRLLATTAIMVIGLGMAAPYAILTSMPGLLKRMPRAGKWMEYFKQALGFLLLIIAIKMIKAVPQENRFNLVYFAVVLSFCIWMWGTWVSYGTKLFRKLTIRGIAVVIVIAAWFFFFTPERIDWQEYDTDVVNAALAEQRPVLIKFTADFCTNCEIIDKLVYKRKDIAKLIKQNQVLAIKANTTKIDSEAARALKNIYNEPGAVPVSVLRIPGEKEPIKWHKIFFADELKEALQNINSGK